MEDFTYTYNKETNSFRFDDHFETDRICVMIKTTSTGNMLMKHGSAESIERYIAGNMDEVKKLVSVLDAQITVLDITKLCIENGVDETINKMIHASGSIDFVLSNLRPVEVLKQYKTNYEPIC